MPTMRRDGRRGPSTPSAAPSPPPSMPPARTLPPPILTYTYDGAGNRATMTLPVGKTVNYGYDAANQLTQLKDWLGNSTALTYDLNGSLASIARPNGVSSTYIYDAAEQLTGLNHDRPS